MPRAYGGRRFLLRDLPGSLAFDGSATKGDSTGLVDPPDSWTIAGWCRRKVMGSIHGMFGASAVSGIYIRANASDQLELLKRTTGSLATSTGVVLAREWVHCAVTYSLSGTDGIITFYINGVAAGTTTVAHFAFAAAAPALGHDGNGAGFFNGLLSDWRMYEAAFTADQVASLCYDDLSPGSATLRHWWKLDEGNASTAADSGATTRNQTITSGTWSFDSPMIGPIIRPDAGTALRFDGTGDIVDIASGTISAALANVAAVSFGGWVKPLAANATVFQLNHSGGLSSLRILYGSTNIFEVNARSTSGGTFNTTASVGKRRLGEWVHVFGVADFAAGTLAIYENGIKTKTAAATFAQAFYNGGAGAAALGAAVGGSSAWTGGIDDFRVYTAALTTAQVRALFLGQSIGASPAFEYLLDEAVGSTAVNTGSVSGGNGTISNAVYTTDTYR